jgi:hypothetical protein
MDFLQQDLDYKNNKNFVFSTGFIAAKELRLLECD